MQLINPWEGTTQAANTLAALGQQIQADKKTDQSNQLAALQLQHLQQQMEKEKLAMAQQQMAMDESQRQIGVRDLARQAYTKAPDNVTQRTLAGSDVGPGAPVANPDYDPAAVSKKATLLSDIATAQQSAKQYPGFASLSGLGDRVAAMQKEADAIPDQQQVVEGDRPQGVTQTVNTPATPQQRSEAMAKVYESAGLLDDAKKVREGALQSLNFDKLMAQQKAEVEAGGGDLEKYYQDKQRMAAVKELIGDVSNPKTPLAVRQAALDTFKKMHPGVMNDTKIDDFNAGSSGGVVNRYDPATGQLIGRLVYNPDKGLEYHAETAADSAHNIVEVPSPDGRTAQKFQYNPTTRKYDQPVGAAYLVKSQVPKITIKTGGGGNPITADNAGPLNTNGVNEAALRGVNPGQAALIKKIANYEIPLPTSRTKENVELMGRVALYDPTFDAQQYPMRQALRKSFTSGPDAKNITSLNTAIHHLDQLDHSFAALGNRSMPLWNTMANKFEAATGDDKLIKVVNDLNAVKGELAATFKGTGATDQEIKAWSDGFTSSSSPAQGKASVQEGIKLLQGRLDALIDKYQSGMGTTKDLQILSPKSVETLTKLGVDVSRYKAFAKGGSDGTSANNGNTRTIQKIGKYQVEVH